MEKTKKGRKRQYLKHWVSFSLNPLDAKDAKVILSSSLGKEIHMLRHLQKPNCYLSCQYPEGRIGHQPKIQSFITPSNSVHTSTWTHRERLFTRTAPSLAANTRISAREGRLLPALPWWIQLYQSLLEFH